MTPQCLTVYCLLLKCPVLLDHYTLFSTMVTIRVKSYGTAVVSNDIYSIDRTNNLPM